ncbi:MAG TPA: glycosyltransferase [Polyangiaceae bacterium]|jgi:hypothetical protein
MKVMIVNEFAFDHYAASLCRALRAIGIAVEELAVGPRRFLDVVRRAQMKYVRGPEVWAANARLVAACARKRPRAVLLWTVPWVYPSTIRAIRAMGARVAIYNNDDPFGPDRDWPMWRAFRRSIPEVDLCFAYRTVNIDEYSAAGARKVRLLRSWFDPKRDRPVPPTSDDQDRFGSDVTFAGHYEEDGRERCVEALIRAGLRVRIFGDPKLWAPVVRRMSWSTIPPVRMAGGDEYARVLSCCKLALVFLSARNRDDYTRRCFEIPAIGAAMLAPRTDTLMAMFRENQEAIFYSTPSELAERARYFASHDVERTRLAEAGHARCLRDGHDVISRARGLVSDLESVLT